jgi:hemerythrin-like domain-containing protein
LGSAAGLAVGTGVTYAATGGGSSTNTDALAGAVTPGEMLMQEHGLLKRTLLVYSAMLDGVAVGTPIPPVVLHGAASVIHDFIEGFHEMLEEAYVFPTLRVAKTLVSTVDTLLTQHAVGRQITSDLLALGVHSRLDAKQEHAAVVRMRAFDRMYEPHEAREDTVVFPAYRELLGDTKLAEMAELFASLQVRQLGRNGFDTALETVAGLEEKMGISDLARFTPTVS